ncbi:MAG: hypothetical protein D6731_24255 [Planctomycetota bacterium]|nr:MAG: hypothetical protein D6731_24255 [Planctomycetota bacterium]
MTSKETSCETRARGRLSRRDRIAFATLAAVVEGRRRAAQGAEGHGLAASSTTSSVPEPRDLAKWYSVAERPRPRAAAPDEWAAGPQAWGARPLVEEPRDGLGPVVWAVGVVFFVALGAVLVLGPPAALAGVIYAGFYGLVLGGAVWARMQSTRAEPAPAAAQAVVGAAASPGRFAVRWRSSRRGARRREERASSERRRAPEAAGGP